MKLNILKKYIISFKGKNFFLIAVSICIMTFFLVGINTFETIIFSLENNQMNKVNNTYSGSFDGLTINEVEKIRNSYENTDIGVTYYVGSIQHNSYEISLFYFDENYFDEFFDRQIEEVIGEIPNRKNEILLSQKVANIYGVELGDQITLEYKYLDQIYNYEFVISGIMLPKDEFDKEVCLVSKDFIKTLVNYEDQRNVSVYVREGKFFLEAKLNNILETSSLTDIPITINPAFALYNNYLFIITVIGGIILFLGIGTIVLENMYSLIIDDQMRVLRQFHAIGATIKQIKKMICVHYLVIVFFQIPISIILGNILSTGFIERLDNLLYPELVKNGLSVYQIVVAVAATCLISMICAYKPIKLLKKKELETIYTKKRTRKRGLNLRKIASINVMQDVKKTVLFICSFSSFTILLVTFFTVGNSLSEEKYVNHFSKTDFVVANKAYFQNKYSKNNTLDMSIVKELENIQAIQGGKIFCSKTGGREYEDENTFRRLDNEIFTTEYNGQYIDLQTYGMDDFPLSKFELVDGTMDITKLHDGSGVLEICDVDDFGNPILESTKFKVGDHIKLKYNGQNEKEYTVLGHVKKIYYFTDLFGWLDYETNIIMSSNEYCSNVKTPLLMSYVFDTTLDAYDDVSLYLKNYQNFNKTFDFKSTTEYEIEFNNIKDIFMVPGMVFLTVLGVIGLTNFCSSMYTKLLNRKEQFIIYRQIGMTYKQLWKLTLIEIFVYLISSMVISAVLLIIIYYFFISKLNNYIWFFYSEKLFLGPYFMCYFIYMICTILIVRRTLKNYKTLYNQKTD